jgi:hypothetical protein
MAKNYPELVGSNWSAWQKLDSLLVYRCDEVWVLCIDGWRESVGVAAEVRLAKGFGRAVRYVIPRDLERGDLVITKEEPECPLSTNE